MTILPKKKVGKDKTTTEQSNHDHHTTSHHSMPESRIRLEPTSIRNVSNAAIEDRHRSSRLRISSEFVNLPNSTDTTAATTSGVSYETNELNPCMVGDTKPVAHNVRVQPAEVTEGNIQNVSKQLPCDATCTGSESLVVKRRHGRLSPHTQPYTRNKPTRCTVTVTECSASCSSTPSSSHHHSRRHHTIADGRSSPSLATNLVRNSRRRQRSRPDGEKDGNNSDDEHDVSRLRQLNQGIDFEELEIKFARALKEIRGFLIKEMIEDGACLFRAVAEQVYGDQNMHDEVRRSCMDYMMKNSDFFSNYVTEDFVAYVGRKRLPHTYGNHLEMQAMAEMYNRSFEVYQYSTEPINTFQSSNVTDNDPIRVSYHRSSHYNAVINPYKASVGVGLGLPSFRPGLADRMLLQEAQQQSEQTLLEEQMLEDKLRAADWESTEDEMLREVAQESFVQYLRHQEEIVQSSKSSHPNDDHSCKKATCSRGSTSHATSQVETKTEDFAGTSSANHTMNLRNPSLGDWVDETEENTILAQVMAQSHREYYDALTHSHDDVARSRDDVTRSRDDVTRSRDDVARSRDDVARSHDDVTRSGDDVARSRDDVARSHDDVTRSRDDVTRSRDDVARSHDDVTRSRDDVARSRDDVTRSRDDVTRSRDDVTRSHYDVASATCSKYTSH